jgi:hypothetical protein
MSYTRYGEAGNQECMRLRFVSAHNSTWLIAMSLAFAWLYITVPWEQLNGIGFPDLQNYLATIAMFERGGEFLSEQSLLVLSILFQELLWGYMLWMAAMFGMGGAVLPVVSLIAAATCWFHVAMRSTIAFAIFVFLNPLLIDLFNSQIRSALAFAILVLALSRRSTWAQILLAVGAITIHAASLVLIALYLACRYLAERVRLRPLMSKFVAICLGIVMAVGIDYARQVVGLLVSQSRFQGDQGTNSLFYAFPWAVIAVMLLVCNVKRDLDRWIPLFGLAAISMFVTLTLLGLYSSRFLAIGLPAVALTLWHLRGHARVIAVTCFIALQSVQAFYWFGAFR